MAEKYITHEVHMKTVQSLLRLSKQMAAYEKVLRSIKDNHALIVNELRAQMALNDDLDRRLNAMTTALSNVQGQDPTKPFKVGEALLISTDDKATGKESLTDHIKSGSMSIEGLTPNKK